MIVRYRVKTNPTCQDQREARAKNKRKLAEEASKPKKRGRPPKVEKKDPSKKAEGEDEEGSEADFSMEEELVKKDQELKTERELEDKDDDEKPGGGRGKGHGKGRRVRKRKVVKERTAASKASPKKNEQGESQKNEDSSHMQRVYMIAHMYMYTIFLCLPRL